MVTEVFSFDRCKEVIQGPRKSHAINLLLRSMR